MVALHVDLQAQPGAGPALEQTFRATFRPAIQAQPGFVEAALLLSGSEPDHYRLVIAFESEPLRLKWVATDLHQQVWPMLAAHCAGYSVKIFSGLA
jgi:heme-degrading monooxygenase HmoA